MESKTQFKLRKWQDGDEEALVEYANNVKIWQNLKDSFPLPYSLQNAKDWISLCKMEANTTVFAIEVEQKAVGSIGIIPQQDIYRKNAEIGYWLAEPFWNRGIMSEALLEVVKYTFATFDINRIFAGIFEYNKPSMRILEKAGFELECVHRKSLYKQNQFYDEYIYVLFRSLYF